MTPKCLLFSFFSTYGYNITDFYKNGNIYQGDAQGNLTCKALDLEGLL
jgi:hypothetical protein